MLQIAELRQETETIVCTCSDPECPFNATSAETEDDEADFFCRTEKDSPDLGFGSMELIPCGKDPTFRYSISNPIQLDPPPSSHKQSLARSTSTSLTNINKGVQKRSNGTILENDYPGFYRTEKNRKCRPLGGGFSMSYLNRLDVNVSEELKADCLVDQDGLTSNHDYMFSRKAPERRLVRNVRREHRSSTSLAVQSKHRNSDGALSMMRQSSADGFYNRHSTASTLEPGFLRLKNLEIKRHTIIA